MRSEQRVLKNTGILYIKMSITMFISLYSTRIVLNTLGVEDFGIYNVVGGLVAMFGFLNATMASATQRFMSYFEGKGETDRKVNIFNSSIILHITIAFIVFIILEIVGVVFFDVVLNIPLDRVRTAKIVYQFSIFSAVMSILTVPYDAVLNSRENMLFFSIIGVIQSLLKLGIAISLSYTLKDKLELYGVLMALISLFTLLIYTIFCHKKYEECSFDFRNKKIKSNLIDMSKFAGWNFSANATGMVTNYGQSIIINVFFGTVVNAAQGVSSQISGQLMAFSNTMLKALTPIIVKSEGSGDRDFMIKSTISGSKLSFFILSFFGIPFIIEAPYILKIWLKDIPDWAIIFCRLQLLKSIVEQFTVTLGSAIGAQGNIKKVSLAITLANLLPLPIMYIAFKNGCPPYMMYLISILFWSLSISSIQLYFAKKNFNFPIEIFFRDFVISAIIVFLITLIIAIIPTFFIEDGFFRLVLISLISSITFIFAAYFFGMNPREKEIITNVMSKLFNTLNSKFLRKK